MSIKLKTVFEDVVSVSEFHSRIAASSPLGEVGSPVFKINDVVSYKDLTGVVCGMSIGRDGTDCSWRYEVYTFEVPYSPTAYPEKVFLRETELALVSE